jgi:alkaline phosphatase D
MAVGSSLAVAGGLREVLAQGVAPGVITRDTIRPQVPYGVMSGDVTRDRAIVWSKTDRPSRLVVEYAFDEANDKATSYRRSRGDGKH